MKVPDKYTLMPFQRIGVDFIKSRKHCLLADEMGLGKTIQSLTACVETGVRTILVICPASIVTQWTMNLKEFYGESFPVFGLGDGTLTQTRMFSDYAVVTSYNFATSKIHVLRDLGFDFCIIDESHFLKDSKSKRTKAILGKNSFIPNCKKTLLMTGTPILNRPIDVYIILKAFASSKLGRYKDYPNFLRRFCGWDGRGAQNTQELSELLQGFMLRRLKEDVLPDLPDTVPSRIVLSGIDLPVGLAEEELPTQRRLISEAKTPAVIKYVKDKLQTVDKIVLIAYHTNTIKLLKEGLQEFNPSVVQGGMSALQKDEAIHVFTKGKSRILLAQLHTIGFGIDGLQNVCDTMVFAELDWSPSVMAQAIDRLRRIGQKNTVFVDYLVAEGTMEKDIELIVAWKKKVIHEVIDEHRQEGSDMPYGFSHSQFEKFPPHVRTTVAKVGGLHSDHGVLYTRAITQTPQLNKEKPEAWHVPENKPQETSKWLEQHRALRHRIETLSTDYYR